MTLNKTASYEELQKVFMGILNKFTPFKCKKYKYLRANHSKFMTKELFKAVMLRTRFRHRFWATVNPLFSNKVKSAENILLSENGKLI